MGKPRAWPLGRGLSVWKGQAQEGAQKTNLMYFVLDYFLGISSALKINVLLSSVVYFFFLNLIIGIMIE